MKGSKESHFVRTFHLDTYMQFGEPTGDLLAELSNVFSSQYEQMCKTVSNPEKNIFSYSLASGQIKCSSESLDFFRWMSKIFFLKIVN